MGLWSNLDWEHALLSLSPVVAGVSVVCFFKICPSLLFLLGDCSGVSYLSSDSFTFMSFTFCITHPCLSQQHGSWLNHGPKNLPHEEAHSVSCQNNFAVNEPITLHFVSQVNVVSLSFSARTVSSNCFSIGLMADTITYFSQTYVSFLRSARAMFTDSSTSWCTCMSCQVRERCGVLWSAFSTCLIAVSCSRILPTIFCWDPQCLTQSC